MVWTHKSSLDVFLLHSLLGISLQKSVLIRKLGFSLSHVKTHTHCVFILTPSFFRKEIWGVTISNEKRTILKSQVWNKLWLKFKDQTLELTWLGLSACLLRSKLFILRSRAPFLYCPFYSVVMRNLQLYINLSFIYKKQRKKETLKGKSRVISLRQASCLTDSHMSRECDLSPLQNWQKG